MSWREHIDIAGVLEVMSEKYDLEREEEPCPPEVGEALAAEASKSIWLNRFGSELRASKSIAETNRILNRLYNDADRHRVWCGM